jgi:hypothetical protein
MSAATSRLGKHADHPGPDRYVAVVVDRHDLENISNTTVKAAQIFIGAAPVGINGINNGIASCLMLISPAARLAILSAAGIETTFPIDVATAAVGIGLLLAIPAGHEGRIRVS